MGQIKKVKDLQFGDVFRVVEDSNISYMQLDGLNYIVLGHAGIICSHLYGQDIEYVVVGHYHFLPNGFEFTIKKRNKGPNYIEEMMEKDCSEEKVMKDLTNFVQENF